MNGKRIGYIRVSTADQNPERQLDGMEIDKKFIDYASGTTTNRPQLQLMIDYTREDDIIIVHSMDRLARNVKDLLELVDNFGKKGVAIQFVKENLVFNGKDSALSKLLLMIIGSVAEFEHSLISERQMEGVRLAQKAGKYKGRESKYTPEIIQKIKESMLTREKKSSIAKRLGISRCALYDYMNRMGIHEKRN